MGDQNFVRIKDGGANFFSKMFLVVWGVITHQSGCQAPDTHYMNNISYDKGIHDRTVIDISVCRKMSWDSCHWDINRIITS